MAWVAVFDGVNDYFGGISITQPTGVVTFRARMMSNDVSKSVQGVGVNSGGRFYIGIHQSKFIIGLGSGAITGIGNAVDEQFYDLELVFDFTDNSYTFKVDGNIESSGTQSASNFTFFEIGRILSNYLDGQVETVELIDANNSSNDRSYDATVSDHGAGTPILVDTVAGNNATGFNMPTDGSAWLDLGGSGITVAGATPDYTYSSIAGAIDLTGSIDVLGQTPSYSYSAISGAIDLTGEILITGNTPNYSYTALGGNVDLTGALVVVGATASYNYQAISGVIDLTGEITVSGQTPNYSYAAINGLVELGALINVIGSTPNYNYQGVNGEVILVGEISVTGDTPSYSYSAISGFVVIGGGQVIGTVTAGFKDDLYSVDYKPDQITVTFKT